MYNTDWKKTNGKWNDLGVNAIMKKRRDIEHIPFIYILEDIDRKDLKFEYQKDNWEDSMNTKIPQHVYKWRDQIKEGAYIDRIVDKDMQTRNWRIITKWKVSDNIFFNVHIYRYRCVTCETCKEKVDSIIVHDNKIKCWNKCRHSAIPNKNYYKNKLYEKANKK